LSHGKNAGVGMATGELLLFTDDDAIVGRRWIRSYGDLFDRIGEGLALAGGPIVPIPHDLGAWPAWLSEEALVDLALLSYDGERILHPPEYVWGGNMAIPRRVMEKMGPWDDTVGRRGDERGTFEDTEYQDRVRTSGGVVWFCPEASIHHRVDRSRLVPRAVVETAFARGRNAFWAENPGVSTDPDTFPRADVLRGVAALGIDLARWTALSLAFRLYSSSRTFDGARRAAWSTGRSLDRLRPGRSRLYRAVARGTFRLRSPALRLTRGTS
jgi:GT2 family glycosyltransferase